MHRDPPRIAIPGCVASCVALRPAVRCDLRCIAAVVASRSALRRDKKSPVAALRACDASRDFVASRWDREGPPSDGSSGL